LRARRTGKGGSVAVRVKNTSTREGDEVVELYVSGGADDAIRDLRGFERVHLKPGESREVEFTVGAGDLPNTKVKISVGGGQLVAGVPHVEGEL